MTKEQKEELYKLRQTGLGYKSISKILEISVDSVKSYCKRHHLNGSAQLLELNTKVIEENNHLCRCCNNPIRKSKLGRTKKFCSEECRRKWWKTHLDKRTQKETAIYHFTCPHCGKAFSCYGNRKRKYCSHICYIQNRFGETESPGSSEEWISIGGEVNGV